MTSTATKLDTFSSASDQSQIPKIFINLCSHFPVGQIKSDSQVKNANDFLAKVIELKIERGSSGKLSESDKKEINDYIHALKNCIVEYENSRYRFKKHPAHEHLADIMKMHELTQEDLAKIIRTEQPQVSRILNGTRKLTTDQIKTLCKRFYVSADLFI